MNLDFTPEENAFRQEIRAFIKANYPADLRAAQDSGRTLTREEYLSWHKVLAKKGWVAPSWPVEFGGREVTPVAVRRRRGHPVAVRRCVGHSVAHPGFTH